MDILYKGLWDYFKIIPKLYYIAFVNNLLREKLICTKPDRSQVEIKIDLHKLSDIYSLFF